MRRRITLTMVGVVAGALLAASGGTLLLLRLDTRVETRRELGRQAERVARDLEGVDDMAALRAVRSALLLEGAQVLRLGPNNRVVPALPGDLSVDDLHIVRLRDGRTVTGVKGSTVYAAAPTERARLGLLVVLLTRRLGATRIPLGPWWLLLVAGTLAAAAAVATDLGRRLTRPLREAQAATRRVAAGDLAARVPVNEDDGAELSELADSINTMAASLERSRGLERQFLLSVSHDLRTPLTSIRGYAEALAEDRAPNPQQAASIILAEARRLERLVGDLLELAKIDARRFSLDVRSIDVAEVVADTAEGFRPAAEKVGVHLEVRADPGGPAAAADPDRLAQVVANLVENALKYARGAIAVGAGADDGQVSIWVEDDGPGIGTEDLPHVFEPFYHSNRTPTREVGTGLGLAIVHELVDAMGGAVRAEPAATGGTRMVVALRPWSGQAER